MLLPYGEMHGKQGDLMLTEEALLNFALTNECVVHWEINLSHHKSLVRWLNASFFDVITLLSIDVCMQQEQAPPFFDLREKRIHWADHLLEIEFAVHLLPQSPWTFVVHVDDAVVD
jgi:hypothetical protein